LLATGTSLKDLHQVSSSDIQVFKKKVVQVILDMCSRNNYANITDAGWFIDVLITLAMEYPQLSADECATRILDLAIRMDDIRPNLPSLVKIIITHKPFFDALSVSSFDSKKIANLSLTGPVVNQPLVNITKEVEIYNRLLTCKYGSNQLPTTEIVDAIANQLLTVPRNGKILSFFSERFFKIMEENNSIYRRPYIQEKMVLTTAARVIKDDDMDQLKSISNLLSVCSWVLGSFICY